MADLLRESIARNSDTTASPDYGKADLHLPYKQHLNAVFCLKNRPVIFFDKLTYFLRPLMGQLTLDRHLSHGPGQSTQGTGACRLQGNRSAEQRLVVTEPALQ